MTITIPTTHGWLADWSESEDILLAIGDTEEQIRTRAEEAAAAADFDVTVRGPFAPEELAAWPCDEGLLHCAGPHYGSASQAPTSAVLFRGRFLDVEHH